MKAIVQDKYGSSDALKLREIDKPVPGDEEVLIRVRAASLHAGDWLAMRGQPYFMRPMLGLFKPKKSVPGSDVAGLVDTVGKNVEGFRPGDAVFGTGNGALAEWTCGAEDGFVSKPTALTFEQAAATPTSALTALQGLRDAGKMEPGQKVLIIGASGGVGTFAVQIAKALGAEVTGVCSTRNVDMVRSIGAERVIDYTKEDLARTGERYDLILDTAGNRPLSKLRSALTANGTAVLVGGRGGPWLMGVGRTVRGLVLSPFISHNVRFFVSMSSKEDLAFLGELMEAGKVTPVIDRTYPLGQTPEALAHVEEGHTRGKTVVIVKSSDE